MKLSPKFSAAFCPNPNDPTVKMLDLVLGEDGLYEFFVKIQTPEFKKWKGDDLFPIIETQEDGDILVYNNRVDFVPLNSFLTTYNIKSMVNKARQSALINLLEEKKPTYNLAETQYYDKNGKKITYRVTQKTKRDWVVSLDETPKSIYQKEKGTVLHKYMEELFNIINRESTFNIANPVHLDAIRDKVYNSLQAIPGLSIRSKEFFYMDAKQMEGLYNYLKNFIGDIKKKDPGAVIMSEVSIHSVKEDLASTIDLIVIKSTGKIGIYDYKGITFYENAFLGIKPEVTEYKKDDASADLEYRKKILIDEYGVRPEDFEELRAIPIDVQYEAQGASFNPNKGFIKVDIGEQEGKEYLRQIPSRHELMGSKALQDQLKILFNRRALVKNQLERNYKNVKLKAENHRLNTIIENLQLKQQFIFIFKDLNTLFNEFNVGKDITDETNPAYLSQGRLVELYADLQSYDGLILAFSEKYKNLESTRKKLMSKLTAYDAKPDKTEVDLINIDAIIAEVTQLNYVKSALTDHSVSREVIKQEILDIVKNRVSNYTGVNLNVLNKPTSFGDMFNQISDIDHSAFEALGELAREVNNEIYEESVKSFDDIDVIDSKLKEWVKSSGLSVQETFNKIIDFSIIKGKPRNKLIMEFTHESWDLLHKKQEENDVTWLKQNTYFDQVAYDAYEKKTFAEIDKSYKDAERASTVKKTLLDRYNAKTQDSALINPHNWFLRPISVDTNKNQRWVDLHKPENKPLLDYYNMLIEYNMKFNTSVDRDISKYFIPNFRKTMAESVLSNGFSILNIGKLKEYLQETMTVREDDDVLGSVDLLTGEQKIAIPLLGYSEVDSRSFDLTMNIKAMIKSVATYKALKNSQDMVVSIKLLLATNQIQEAVTDNDNKNFINKFTRLAEVKLSAPTNSLELFDTFYKKIWGGQYIQGKEIFSAKILAKSLNDKSGKKLSSKKLFSNAIMINNLKALSGNVYSIAQNTIGGQMNLWANAAEGIFFNRTQLTNAHKDYIGSNGERAKHISRNATSFFGIGRSQSLDRNIGNSAASNLVKHITAEKGYIGQELLTSRPFEIATTGATMKNYGLLNGLPVRLELMPAGTKSIEDLAKLDSDGRITDIDGMSVKGKGQFRDLIHKLIGRSTGEVDASDQSAYNTNILMRVLMEFRGWFVPMYMARFQGTHKDKIFKEFLVGKYTAAFHNTLGGAKGMLLEFGKYAGEAASMGLYKNKINSEAMEFYYQKFLEENPQYKGQLTLPQFVALHEKRLRGLVVELRAILAITALITFLMMDWDDDGEPLYADNIVTRQLFTILTRGQAELSFFLSPLSFTKMAQNPIPLMGLFTDTYKLIGNTIDETIDLAVNITDLESEKLIRMLQLDDKNDRTSIGHYVLKMLPIVHPATQFFELTEDHLAK